MKHPNTESHSSNDRFTVGFLLLSFPCIANISFTHVPVLDEGWRSERSHRPDYSLQNNIVYFFLFLPSLCPVPHYSALLFLLNASHAHDSGLLPGEGSVPVKTTHARMTVQMHDSVMARQPEAKLAFKQMHVRTHAQSHDTHLVKRCFYLCMVFWCKWPTKHLNGSCICISNSFDSSRNRQSNVKMW